MKYRDSKSVIISEQRKYSELNAFHEISTQFPIIAFAFRKGIISPCHDVLAVAFMARLEDKSLRFLVDITPSRNYPNEEPGAVLIEPDISALLIEGIRAHVYDDLEGRLLCCHLTEWYPKCSMAKFFINAVYPWANNFLGYLSTDGLWKPELWNKTVREEIN